MRVLVLCDGGGPIGVGHVIRSLALAEASVAAGHEVAVAGHFEGSFVQGQLATAPVEVVQLEASMADGDLQPVIDLIRRLRPDVLHVDSYEAQPPFWELVVSPGVEPRLDSSVVGTLVLSNMEDGSFGRRPAEVVIDPTFGAERSPRPEDGSTWLLRGSRYAPIRQRVVDAREHVNGAVNNGSANSESRVGAAAGEVARSVLVVMGGSDPVGLAPVAVKLLARTGLALEVTVIAVGDIAERVRAAAEGARLSLNVLAPVDDLAAVMARQDLVISAAGTSVWELCCIGVPMAVLWSVDNQCEGYDRVVAAGAAVGLGGPELAGRDPGGHELSDDEGAVGRLRTALTDSRVRADLAVAGRHIVDGLGAWRIVRTWEQALRLRRPARPESSSQPSSGQGVPYRLTARPAGMQDARLLWEWRNDPATRASSRSSAEVPWDDHLAWLAASLTRTDRMLLVVEDPVGPPGPAGPVGTVRWDRTQEQAGEHEWEVSITVAPERRGQSLARPMLRAAEVALSSATSVTAYLATVHIDNQASLRLFEASAYVPDVPPDQRGFMWFRKAARVA